MGLAAGLNEYGYALGNPVSFTDALGLDVDINLFPLDSDPYNFAKLYPNNPLECTIAGHGTPFEAVPTRNILRLPRPGA